MATGDTIPVPASALAAVGATAALTTVGFAEGWWWPNVHNGLLAATFAAVGIYLVHQRPSNVVGKLFLATGVIQGVIFAGRQLGRGANTTLREWSGWFGVWPIAVGITATTLCVLLFPDGRLPSPSWRPVVAAICVLGAASATISALWPVEYSAASVDAAPPFTLPGADAMHDVWTVLAHPLYAAMQVMWAVALGWRWRVSSASQRRPLWCLVAAAGLAALALVVGLAIAHSPRAGLLATALLPVAAGWSIVHGQQVTARRALAWLSREDTNDGDLPIGICRAAGDALDAQPVELWIGSAEELDVVGRWPDDGDYSEPTSLGALCVDGARQTRAVRRGDAVIGALTIGRSADDPLSLAQRALFDDLASQATLVVDHLSLARVVARERAAGHLDELTERERSVLELMARGLSNNAISDELHLSIKTVEPVISTIFMKLGLHVDATSNRRVLAVLAYLRR